MPRSASHQARDEEAAGYDFAALALRVAIGPMLMYHGYNKVAGPGGLAGTTQWFDELGLKPAAAQARIAAATELAAGLSCTLGVAAPMPAAATIGLMAVAARTDHRGKGFFIFKGGAEYVLIIAIVALAQAALGPGRWSLDGRRGGTRRGPKWALAAGGLGLGSAAGILVSCYRPVSPEHGENGSLRGEPVGGSAGQVVPESGGAEAE